MSEPTEFSIEDALKGVQWERAKGELRACVVMSGSNILHMPPNEKAYETERWEKFEARVNEFIESVEADGLHE